MLDQRLATGKANDCEGIRDRDHDDEALRNQCHEHGCSTRRLDRLDGPGAQVDADQHRDSRNSNEDGHGADHPSDIVLQRRPLVAQRPRLRGEPIGE